MLPVHVYSDDQRDHTCKESCPVLPITDSTSVISADVECSLSEIPAQHLLRAVRSPRLKASDSDPRPTPLANT